MLSVHFRRRVSRELWVGFGRVDSQTCNAFIHSNETDVFQSTMKTRLHMRWIRVFGNIFRIETEVDIECPKTIVDIELLDERYKDLFVRESVLAHINHVFRSTQVGRIHWLGAPDDHQIHFQPLSLS